MNEKIKEQILQEFVRILDQINNKPSDEIESSLQKMVYKIRPFIHMV